MGSIEEIYRISAKTQEVVDDYDNYVGGGLAPYPVSVPSNPVRCHNIEKQNT
jgi:ornithine--oxo-acid transaminase